MKVSFVIPAYQERESLAALVAGILEHVAPHEPQIILIDDGSDDGTYEEICALRARHGCIRVIRFRRNLGKSAGLAAGFARADGDIVFTMDADLQDDPAEIPRFIEKLEEGFDMVVGWKKVRRDPWHKVLPSRVYNRAVSTMFGLRLHDVNCGFKLFRRDVVRKLAVYGERHRLLPVLAAELGYRTAEIPVQHHARRFGRSKYGLERFTRGALDAMTMFFMHRYARAPVHFFGLVGGLQVFLGVFAIVAGLISWLTAGAGVWAATLLIGGVVLFVGGGAAVSLGLIWEMVLQVFAPKDPGLYIVEESPEEAADAPRDQS